MPDKDAANNSNKISLARSRFYPARLISKIYEILPFVRLADDSSLNDLSSALKELGDIKYDHDKINAILSTNAQSVKNYIDYFKKQQEDLSNIQLNDKNITPNKQDFDTAINDVLQESATVLETTNETITKSIENIKSKSNYSDSIDQMHKAREKACTAIKNHYEKSKESLAGAFNDDVFKNKMLKAYSKESDADGIFLEDVQKKIQEKLDTSHKENEKKMKEEFEKSITTTHELNAIEIADKMFINMLIKNSIYNKERLLKHAKNMRNKSDSNNISLEQTKNNNPLENISVKNIQDFTTATGADFKITSEDGKTTISGKLSSKVGYRTQSELDTVAMAFRATGKNKIKMSVTHNNPVTALQLGRQAYDACIKANFDPEKIKIEVNGKECSLQDLKEKKTPGLDAEGVKGLSSKNQTKINSLETWEPIKVELTAMNSAMKTYKDSIGSIKKEQMEVVDDQSKTESKPLPMESVSNSSNTGSKSPDIEENGPSSRNAP